jgi:hypothetical protein
LHWADVGLGGWELPVSDHGKVQQETMTKKSRKRIINDTTLYEYILLFIYFHKIYNNLYMYFILPLFQFDESNSLKAIHGRRKLGRESGDNFEGFGFLLSSLLGKWSMWTKKMCCLSPNSIGDYMRMDLHCGNPKVGTICLERK